MFPRDYSGVWSRTWFFICLSFVGCLSRASATVYVTTAENVTYWFPDADAAFGGPIAPSGMRGTLYKADPLNGCGPLKPERSTPGEFTFVLIERGDCQFDTKIRHAQDAGFSAVIVFNDENSRELITMSGHLNVYIPAVFVTKNSGLQLLALLQQPGSVCFVSPTFENTAWSVMAMSFISLVAVSSVLATFFFVRRHRLRRVGSRLVLTREPVGMSARAVKALPSFTFKSSGGGNGTRETCTICLEDYEVGDKLRVLPCRHEFHVACIDPWLTTQQPLCPVCKRNAHDASPGPPPSEVTPLLVPSSLAGTSETPLDIEDDTPSCPYHPPTPILRGGPSVAAASSSASSSITHQDPESSNC